MDAKFTQLEIIWKPTIPYADIDEGFVMVNKPDILECVSLAADAIVANGEFRKWLIQQTNFSEHAPNATSLSECQKKTRASNAKNWWQDYWILSESCSCQKCDGRPTDFFCVFETPHDFRFAIHAKIVRDHSNLTVEMAGGYRQRAECWKDQSNTPSTIVPHNEATTILICRKDYSPKGPSVMTYFDRVLYIEDIVAKLDS
ncbi:MAG: hypothetical protein P1U49_15305 [Minwuia sp.]|nr:hypothetical protein [Minwuia sp.]